MRIHAEGIPVMILVTGLMTGIGVGAAAIQKFSGKVWLLLLRLTFSFLSKETRHK
jgi:hypothetical protein